MDTFKVGSIEIGAVLDGEISHPFADAFPGGDTACFCRHGGVDGGRIAYRMTTFVIRASGRIVLVDTGLGPTLSPLDRWGYTGTTGLLPAALAAEGIAPEQVDAVVLTHLHPDHVGWNTADGEGGRPMFPNAEYLVSRPEWDFWGPTTSKIVAQHVRPIEAAGQLRVVDDGFAAAPGVSLLLSPGHTPGHVCVLAVDGGTGAIVLGDAAHHPAELEDTAILASADRDQHQGAATRASIAARAQEEGLLVLGGHFPLRGAGHIIEVAQRRTWRYLGASG